jgi:hypothetical protein
MREDMDKVIVERPRYGSRTSSDDKGERKRLERARFDPDLLPARASTSRGRRAKMKHLNEHLGPMRRFLNSRVGQHWNKVYAEVRQRINPDSTQQMHILQHLLGPFGYVQTDVKVGPEGTFTDLRGRRLDAGWFVNPKTGCLQRNPQSYYHGGRATWRWPRVMPREPAAVYVRRDGKHFREIEGVWYEVELRPVALPLREHPMGPPFPDRWPEPQVFDAILRCHPTYGQLRAEHGDYVYAAAKRQISSREIRRYQLRALPLVLPQSPTRR